MDSRQRHEYLKGTECDGAGYSLGREYIFICRLGMRIWGGWKGRQVPDHEGLVARPEKFGQVYIY